MFRFEIPVNEEVTEYEKGHIIMDDPGLVVRQMNVKVNLSLNGQGKGKKNGQGIPRDVDITIITPGRQELTLQEANRYRCPTGVNCFGLNGIWILNLTSPRPVFLRSWAIDFTVDAITPIEDYGTIETIIGDGSVYDQADLSTQSQSGQDALGPLGGRSWGILLDANKTIYFNSLDQGYVARLRNDGTVEHLATGLKMPMVMDFAPNGDIYVAEFGGAQITRLSKASDYRQKTALLKDIVKQPMGVRFGRFGPQRGSILYIVDSGNHRIMTYNINNGQYQVLINESGDPGYEEEATLKEAHLFYPIDIDVNEYGVMAIADGMNNRIRGANLGTEFQFAVGVIVPPGKVVNLAGVGPSCDINQVENPMDSCPTGFSGDGGPALEAEINWPFNPRFDSQQRLFFTDSDNHRIRVIEPCSLIYTIAGNAPLPQERGFRYIGSAGIDIGEGVNPLDADINRAMDLYLDEKEPGVFDLYIGDTDNNVVRKISNLIFYNHGALPNGAFAKLELNQLTKGVLTANGFLGYASHMENYGNLPAPGALLGCLPNMFSNLERKPIKF